jgi:hypothetical protein
MGAQLHYALLQRELTPPNADQVKRAFQSFSHLTDADAVRLAVNAQGILGKHLTQDAARALQESFQKQGIDSVIVAERNLPTLPEARSLNRIELWPQALVLYDPLGRPATLTWDRITLIAAGAAQGIELGRTYTEFRRIQLNDETQKRAEIAPDSNRRVQPELHFLLEFLVDNSTTRYEIDASQLTFKYVIDRPGLALQGKFVWLVRQFCREAPRAMLNRGAQSLREGQTGVPVYLHRQMLADEIIWLLWRAGRAPKISGT